MNVLIDSDILIEVSRGRDTAILAAWMRLRNLDAVLMCRPVNVAELCHGAIGLRAGDFLRAYARSQALDLGDALIAATASVHGAELWTPNRKHYPMNGLSFFRKDAA